MNWKISAAKWQPFCLCPNMLHLQGSWWPYSWHVCMNVNSLSIMAWYLNGSKPLSSTILKILIILQGCIRQQWVNPGMWQHPSEFLKIHRKWISQLLHRGLNKMAGILQKIFGMHFPESKYLRFDWNFTKSCSWWPNWQQTKCIKVRCLATSRRCAITWTNESWRHMRSLDHNELTCHTCNAINQI